MAADAIHLLLRVTLASSAALMLLFVVRRPLRALAGARIAYALWLLVPALVLASLLPAPPPHLVGQTVVLPAPLGAALEVDAGVPADHRAATFAALLAIWGLGAAAMSFAVFRRQRAFSRSLGPLARDADGLHRSATVDAPLLTGWRNPRIVVPADFDTRYSGAERELILEHERVHARRGDVAVNAFATFFLCVFWFNPLVYRALSWLRADQELACDAHVMSRWHGARRCYATALLKAQLASDAAWRAPIGCRWQSTHPLTERIAMLKRPLPGISRRAAGFILVVALAGGASLAAWAGKPGSDAPQILIDLKITISNPQTHESSLFTTRYLVNSGEETKDAYGLPGLPMEFSCRPWLADMIEKSETASHLKARGIQMRERQILVECTLRRDGEVIERPALLVGDGVWGTIDMSERGGPRQFRIEVRPSTSAADLAAAKDAPASE